MILPWCCSRRRSTNMKTTMRAAVVRDFGKPLVVEDVPVPSRALAKFWSR
jgi:hypothetical protein